MTLASLGNFFGIDTLLIVLVILFFVGGSKIPQVAKSLREAFHEFKKAKNSDKS